MANHPLTSCSDISGSALSAGTRSSVIRHPLPGCYKTASLQARDCRGTASWSGLSFLGARRQTSSTPW